MQVVLVSPLTRALQTALVAFSGKNVPFVCVESLRERIGVNPCDKRRATHELVAEFASQHVDFSALAADDTLWTADVRETDDELLQRGLEVVQLIRERPESNIAVVTHSSFLSTFMNNVLQTDDEHYRSWFENCDMRSCVFDFS